MFPNKSGTFETAFGGTRLAWHHASMMSRRHRLLTGAIAWAAITSIPAHGSVAPQLPALAAPPAFLGTDLKAGQLPAAPKNGDSLASKPYLVTDSPLEGVAIVATFRYHLMIGGIKTLTVADVWGSRAAKAGLKNGDQIVRIEGKPVVGMNIFEAKHLIDPYGRSPKIRLAIQHVNSDQTLDVDLPRGPQGGK